MADWNVPDWTVPTAYPDPSRTTLREWWWEFTRRRPEYREAWVEAAPTNQWGYRYALDVDAFRLKFEMSVIYDPARSFSDWELMQMRYPTNYGFGPTSRQSGFPDELVNQRAELAAAHGIHYFAFDLSRPLPGQLAKAKQMLEHIQAERKPDVKSRRPRTMNWPTFLRCLDARDADATYAEIAAVLWPGNASAPEQVKARDTFKAACQVRDNFPL